MSLPTDVDEFLHSYLGLIMFWFSNFVWILACTPVGDGCEVKWSAVYEKVSHDISDPTLVKDFAVKNFLEVDAYVQANA